MAYVRSYGGNRPPGRTNRFPPKEISDRLPMRAAPQFGESVLGYIARQAELNMMSVSAIVKAAGLDPLQLWYSDSDVSQLAAYTQQDPAVLRELAPAVPYKANGDVFTCFLGHNLDPETVYHDHNRRICPACLRADGIYKATWDLRVVQGCTQHSLRLVSECPDCTSNKGKRTPLTWRTPDLRFCGCGCDLREAAAEAYPESHQLAQRLLEAMLLGRDVEKPPLLADLEPGEILRLLVDFADVPLWVRDIIFPGHDRGLRNLFGEYEGWLRYSVNNVQPELGLRLSLGLTILSLPPTELEAAFKRAAAVSNGRPFHPHIMQSFLRSITPRGAALREMMERLNQLAQAHQTMTAG